LPLALGLASSRASARRASAVAMRGAQPIRNGVSISVAIEPATNTWRRFASSSPAPLASAWWWTDLYHRFWTVEPKTFFTSEPISAEEKRALGLPEDGFASRIVQIDPAAQVYNVHRLKVGDIITAVDGVQRDDFTQKLDTYITLTVDSGLDFEVDYVRDGVSDQMEVRTYREAFRKPEI
jgi:hypothetical protein